MRIESAAQTDHSLLYEISSEENGYPSMRSQYLKLAKFVISLNLILVLKKKEVLTSKRNWLLLF